MKKALLISLSVIAFLVLALLLIPFIFRDKIKTKIDQEIASSINARVVYQPEDISLSILRHFPDLTISIDDFALIGKVKEFEGDTLYAAKSTRFVANIMSVLSGGKIELKQIYLDEPLILTKMTKDGKMSWDIAVSSPTDTTKPSEPTQFNLGIDEWEIKNGRIIYDDESLPMYAELRQVDHKGSGDLTQDEFIMNTHTLSPDVLISYGGVKYMNGNTLEADIKMNMNYTKMIFKFLENQIRVNNFIMGFDGLIAMPGADINFDMKFNARETAFKNLISLIPAIYTKDYNNIKTEGKLAFDGFVKGTMSDSLMPGYGLNLVVNDAMFQYPSLPTAVRNIAIDLHVLNEDGVTENMVVDLKKFHLEAANNPIDARVLMKGLTPSTIDANALATVNLEDITKIYPIDSFDLKGVFSTNVKANGVYSDHSMPKVNATMSLKNGYVKTAEVPEPIQNIDMSAIVLNNDGTLTGTNVNLEKLTMNFENEPFFVKAFVENLDDPHYDVTLKGILDLTKISKIYPVDGMNLAGLVKADIETKGIMSDVEAGNYLKTSTTGSMQMTDFVYSSSDMPQGVQLSSASFTFNPKKATINEMKGYLGKSDINVRGYMSNYLGYIFGADDSTIHGKMALTSNQFDVNEWMTDDTTTSSASEPADTGIFVVPVNVDFVLSSTITKVLYTNMTLEDLKGDVILKDGIARLSQLTFNTLGGNVGMDGSYNTQDVKKPEFDIAMNINKIGIKNAYQTFNTVKSFAPIAQNLEGNFSTKLTMKGLLKNNMTPDMNTLDGNGTLTLQNATLESNSIMQSVQSLTKMNLLPLQLKDIFIQYAIHDGKISVKPFDVKAGNTTMKIQGNQSVTGNLDYLVNMYVPTGAVGAEANNALAGLIGTSATNSNQNVKLDLKVGGTFEHPKVALAGSSVKEQAGNAVKDAVKQEAMDVIHKNPEAQQAVDEVQKVKQDIGNQAKTEKQQLEKQAENEVKKETEQKAKDALKKLPFGK